ncbi:cytochrome oxidase small assembly protein [Ramlibacter sp.]
MTDVMADDDRRKKNFRLALILASIAIVFFVGFVGKMLFLGK